jgi:hypothetical protein
MAALSKRDTDVTQTLVIMLSGNSNVQATARTDLVPATTPLPAALPLFATGIGALGLLGWRRKRRVRADARTKTI